MCGRFTLAVDPADLIDAFGLDPNASPDLAVVGPRFNIAPTQAVAVVPNTGPRHLEVMRWGLIPSWAKDPKIGNTLINARGETVAEKPSFRSAFKRRRCLILADGFYEWKKEAGGGKTPYFIQLADERPFAFAGLWEVWRPADGSELPTCTIVTTTPNAVMAQLHDRMPVIVPPEHYDTWLAEGERPAPELLSLIQPYAGAMKARPVSTRVNSPRFDDPTLLEKLPGGA